MILYIYVVYKKKTGGNSVPIRCFNKEPDAEEYAREIRRSYATNFMQKYIDNGTDPGNLPKVWVERINVY